MLELPYLAIMLSPFQRIQKLRRAHHKKSGQKAPHKPVMLLAVLQLFEEGLIQDNRIEITPELVATFNNLWLRLVPENHWQPRIFLPFYHLSTEAKPFWFLQPLGGFNEILTNSYSPKSLMALDAVVQHAYLAPAFYQVFMDQKSRALMEQTIMNSFFPDKQVQKADLVQSRKKYLEQMEFAFYGKMQMAAENEEEYEVRSTIFKQKVPRIYNYQCAISGLKVDSTLNVSMVDACHIEPWSVHHNDTIQNGICLTPTLHRAFDRGLISISDDYRVLVSDRFREDGHSTYSLGQFKHKLIHLPKNSEHRPSSHLLENHRRTFGFDLN